MIWRDIVAAFVLVLWAFGMYAWCEIGLYLLG